MRLLVRGKKISAMFFILSMNCQKNVFKNNIKFVYLTILVSRLYTYLDKKKYVCGNLAIGYLADPYPLFHRHLKVVLKDVFAFLMTSDSVKTSIVTYTGCARY